MELPTFTLATFANMIATFDDVLAKAAGDARGDALLGARLADDMFPLASQVRIASFQVLNTLNRVAGTSLTPFAADPASIAEARSQLAEVKAAIAKVDAGAFVADDTVIEFDLPNGMAFAMTAAEYVRDWSVSQLYFHVTAAYAILRKEGVPLGKLDFMGYMTCYAKAPASA